MDYQLLPFNFERFDENRVFISNFVGEYVLISNEDFEAFINNQISPKDDLFLDLESKQIITRDNVSDVIKMLATKYRTKKSILNDFTTLHMVVPTLRCNSSCIYCQVARKNFDDHSCEMTKETAKKVIDIIFSSPSPNIKIEFQGGEPTCYFEMVKFLIEEAEYKNAYKRKNLEFVICTNLTLLTEEKVRYLKKHHCYISTSLDGPEFLHNLNRPLQSGENYYALFKKQVEMVRSVWGDCDCISALMTTTKTTLDYITEVVDEYVSLGFNSIFIRSLNPYGFAKQRREQISYSVEDFLQSYKKGLDYIIDLNKKGTFFVEGFAALLLRRILTPFATGFVDLQSPAGVGIACAIYDYDGNVFVSDEARMMARFKNYTFKLGNVNTDSYQSMFNGELLHTITANACTECLPECSYCPYQQYCGADPVRNLSEQGDMVGIRSSNEMCIRTKGIIKYLIELIERHDPELNKIFWSWIR
ncbi:MAG: His-Xaa-Ser system radical SAM maturase HxsB [Succinivibrio sp.]|jgi:His-Xaa-Ser system radical SAM maturase HxsB|nr:His-Xaa-Ser system radical SAM maturase HxsB [Succinivibrio sp.]